MRNKYLWAAISWTIFITVLCLMSSSSLEKMDVVTLPNKDKVLHFVFYMVFTACWFLAVRLKYGSSKKVIAAVFLFAVIYGILIELCQLEFANGRSADAMDAVANTLGSATAILLIWISKKYKESR